MSELSIRTDDVEVLTSDGRILRLRDVTAADRDQLLALHENASDDSIYRRFFTANRSSAVGYAAGLARANSPEHRAIGAFAHDRLVGIAVFEQVGRGKAEFAVLVADDWQFAGVGTMLLEHLIAEAREAGINRFVAEVLTSNLPMFQVMRDLGFPTSKHLDGGQTDVEFSLDVCDRLVDAVTSRDELASAASLEPLLTPASVAVIGAGRTAGSVGHEVLRNLLAAGFSGAVYAVNPNATEILGVPCVASPAELPEAPDLAVIALRADQVADAVRACGERGGHAAVLLGSGFRESGEAGAGLQDEIVAIARQYGMRLVGPNCIGIINTDPAVRLNATFSTVSPRPGSLAVLAQSGAVGVAVLQVADRLGLGIAQFVSVGNKADVGGNDLLLAWARDPRVRVIAAYLESIGDQRRFARIARAVSSTKPIIAIKSGRTEVGQRAGQSHTAAATSSDIAIEALLKRSGVVRVRTMQELLDGARMLTEQPVPGGPRVAIVGNSGGPEILAADAASDAGLSVTEFDPPTVAELRALGVAAANPLDLGAAVQPEQLRRILRVVASSSSVDSVLTVFTDVAVNDPAALREQICCAAAESDKPFGAVAVGAGESSWPVPGTGRAVPVFTFPEPAVDALAVAHRYAQLAASPERIASRPVGTNPDAARSLVCKGLAEGREWLTPAETYQVLTAYGLPVGPEQWAANPDEAVSAATQLGYPVALKIGTPGLHKSDVAGVRLGITNEAQLRATFAELAELDDAPQIVQPMAPKGTELIVGAVHDKQCGPIVMFGAGGVLTDILGDRSFALAPMTDDDAEDMITELRSARLLDGYRGGSVVPHAAVRDVLVRVATLVSDVPQIAALDINPLVASPSGLRVLDARIQIAAPPAHPDPLVRQLRSHDEHPDTR